ncbi:MAG: sigma-70 family RNA polymerase sigma factor [bacterium]
MTQDDDATWIEDCVREHGLSLVSYADRLLNDADRARDVVQNAFIKLCRQSRQKVEPKAKEWLFTVCRNEVMDILRKEHRMTPLDDRQTEQCPCSAPLPSEKLESTETNSRLIRVLNVLPPNQRDVIRLKFLHNMSYKEISRVTRLSVSNVGFLIHTGLKTMRGQMNQQEGSSL